jgi:hypothetical protein
VPSGQEFIRHEFDEAIAVQQSIVQGATQLSQVHPMAPVKRQLQTASRDSEKWLKRLQTAGSKFGATGAKEDVAQGIDALAQTTLRNAQGGEPSEVYEAHAVLINAVRKQQDSAGSIIKIARSLRDRELANEAREMQRASKQTADGLAKSLTELAVVIATEGREKPAPRRTSSRTRTTSGSRSTSGKRSTSGTRSASGGRSGSRPASSASSSRSGSTRSSGGTRKSTTGRGRSKKS